jgi:hypothetical protein
MCTTEGIGGLVLGYKGFGELLRGLFKENMRGFVPKEDMMGGEIGIVTRVSVFLRFIVKT